MRHHLITLTCFSAAALLYYVGMRDNAALLVAAAALSELIGWKRMLGRRRAGKPTLY